VLRIDTIDGRPSEVLLKVSGDLRPDDLAELQRVMTETNKSAEILTIDLCSVTLACREAVEFLGSCEAAGVTLSNCPAYLREWITSEMASRERE
jgi:hypothetical protein